MSPSKKYASPYSRPADPVLEGPRRVLALSKWRWRCEWVRPALSPNEVTIHTMTKRLIDQIEWKKELELQERRRQAARYRILQQYGSEW
jgi:hypothetical protein